VETQALTALNLGLDQITKFIFLLDGPLVKVTYRGLTQSVFKLDRINSNLFYCPAESPVDSSPGFFTPFNSGSSSPEVVEFYPNLCLICVIAWV
jgi:hypothetical protein